MGDRSSQRFNPFSIEFQQNPYPVYAELQRNDPYHRVMGTWVLTRYRDVVAVLKDRNFSSTLFEETIKRNKPDFGGDVPDPIESFVRKSIVFTENPDHSRLRRLVIPCFSRTAMEEEREAVSRLANKVIKRVMERGGGDVVADIADAVPLLVTAGRIGLDAETVAELPSWVLNIRKLLDPGIMARRDYEQAHEALNNFSNLVRKLINTSGSDGRSNMLVRLAMNRDGEDRLTESEIVLTAIMTFVAGTETSKALIGNSVYLLLKNPGELQKLRESPALMTAAVEEVMRMESPLQQTKRIALKDIDIGGVTIKKGDQVLLCLGAANRDPEQYEQPDCFDISRTNPSPHLAFGYGMRSCLGASLAMLETEVVLKELFMSNLKLTCLESDLRWQSESRILRALERLPVTLEMSANVLQGERVNV